VGGGVVGEDGAPKVFRGMEKGSTQFTSPL
jgi:hypothetical protein